MKIKIYVHTSPTIANANNEQRICVALLSNQGKFVDSFDYDIKNNAIRFYGSSKHYKFDEIPLKKQKLWATSDFSKLLFRTYIL